MQALKLNARRRISLDAPMKPKAVDPNPGFRPSCRETRGADGVNINGKNGLVR